MAHTESVIPPPKTKASKPKIEPTPPPAPKSDREAAFDRFLAQKPLKNPPPQSGQEFAQEFMKVVPKPQFDIIKVDLGPTLSFYDLMTKKRLLMVYCRHIKRTSLFKHQNEAGLFTNPTMANLINSNFAFTGIDESVSTSPYDLLKFKIRSIDFPCILIFQQGPDGSPVLVHKICLKQVGGFADEKCVIDEVQKKVQELSGISPNRQKSSLASKTDTKGSNHKEPVQAPMPKPGLFRDINLRSKIVKPKSNILDAEDEMEIEPPVEPKPKVQRVLNPEILRQPKYTPSALRRQTPQPAPVPAPHVPEHPSRSVQPPSHLHHERQFFN